jgi:hypothetical protein
MSEKLPETRAKIVPRTKEIEIKNWGCKKEE